MAIVKTDFFAHTLNQFVPNRVRGEYLDWGLNAHVMEVKIDESVEDALYAGDKVAIVPTSTGKLKVKAATASDRGYGYILFNPKHIEWKAGMICSVLCDGGVISGVTEEAIQAGTVVYYNATDGSVTATASGNPMGIALEDVPATEGGRLIAVEVHAEPLAE